MMTLAYSPEPGQDRHRNKKMRKLVGVMLLSLSATAVAFGAARVSAPELDPASAMAALTLLGGGLAVLRGRRRR